MVGNLERGPAAGQADGQQWRIRGTTMYTSGGGMEPGHPLYMRGETQPVLLRR